MNLGGLSRMVTQAMGIYNILNKPLPYKPSSIAYPQEPNYNNYKTNYPPISGSIQPDARFYIDRIKSFLYKQI